MTWTSTNPFTGDVIASYPVLDREGAGELLGQAANAQTAWAARPLTERAALIMAWAETLTAQRQSLADLATSEMGKPISQALAEVDKCAWCCRHLAAIAAEALADETVATDSDALQYRLEWQPMGVVLAIMPWNFPYWQVVRMAAGALLAGNAVLVKHAPTTMGCSQALIASATAAGIPADILCDCPVAVSSVPNLIGDARLAAASLTGSTTAGRAVASICGEHLKPCVLELGGSDPYLVLADADLDHAAAVCASARLINNGQSCIAAKRLIVDQRVHAAFVTKLEQQLSHVVSGDPADPATTLGPMARADLREQLHRQVSDSIAAGAVCRIGGSLPSGPGFAYPATLLDQVTPGMPAADEELFGPVCAVLPVADTAAAIALAAASPYGLGAAVFTADRAQAEAVAAQLPGGAIAINGAVASDPRVPFGGTRDSGWGRELGHAGLRAFCHQRTIAMHS